ncbi:MAG: ParB/RepB/Spo0J family partition protein [candidate division KSB1 bacterium]|nr:ParB/RepB/Spo0J family partition protein [candidate division KSB1 bacterium]
MHSCLEEPEENQSSPKQAEAVHFINVRDVSANPFQPREIFDSEKIDELANSIAEKGMVQPVTVRPYEGKYQLVAGERRLRAVQLLGLEELPAYVLNIDNDEDMMELSIIENIHRENLNPIDIANGYKRLIDECDLTQEQVARKVGKDRATVTNFLRLLKLPKRIQKSAQNGDISMGHARALLGTDNAETQLDIWNKIIKQNLSVRQVEKAVRSAQKPDDRKAKLEKPRSPYIEDAENRLQMQLATKVKLKPKTKGGVIEIEYYGDDDLERLLSIMHE